VAVQVIAVHRDVERADRYGLAAELAHERSDALGERDSAGGDAEDHQILGPLVGLEDLVRDPSQSPGDVGLVQHGARAHPPLPSPPHGTGLKVAVVTPTLPDAIACAGRTAGSQAAG